MKKKTEIWVWSLLVLAVVLGVVWQFYPLPDADRRMEKLPLNGEGFQGVMVPLTPMEKDYFTNVGVLKRIYSAGGQDFFIYALDGTHNRNAVHDPTYCFRGGGWEILDQESYPIKNGVANLYTIQKGDQKRHALLWFSDGNNHWASPIRYFLAATYRRLTLGQFSNEPIMIVIQPIGQKELNWEKIFKDFPQILSI